MMENRSFDHMLGHLKFLNPEVEGLTGKETNPVEPSDSTSEQVKVSFDAPYLISMDPGHSFQASIYQHYYNIIYKILLKKV